ncbi:MAG: hypothetical protein K2X01_11165 [Cyanobacteria bacterium]|nr:hypothetical protein [Cyanobacteriota bacterium]
MMPENFSLFQPLLLPMLMPVLFIGLPLIIARFFSPQKQPGDMPPTMPGPFMPGPNMAGPMMLIPLLPLALFFFFPGLMQPPGSMQPLGPNIGFVREQKLFSTLPRLSPVRYQALLDTLRKEHHLSVIVSISKEQDTSLSISPEVDFTEKALSALKK